LVLTASNTYNGGTTVSGGALQIGSGSSAGSIAGNLTDNGLLVFNRSDNPNFAGAISGTGGLVQAGPGTLVLSGTSGYNGGTTVSGGTLAVSGSLASSVNVNSLTTLAGSGSVGVLAVSSSAHLVPGWAASAH